MACLFLTTHKSQTHSKCIIGEITSFSGPAFLQASDEASANVYAEGGISCSAPSVPSYKERFKPYEQFGLMYDAGKNELQYNGKARHFRKRNADRCCQFRILHCNAGVMAFHIITDTFGVIIMA